MAFTHADAEALRQRLESGWSVLDPEGNECAVPTKKRRPPKGTVPSADELLKRYRNAEEQNPSPQVLLDRIRRAAGRSLSSRPAHEPLDLSPFARMAGVSVEDALGMPDDAPAPVRYSPVREALSSSRVPHRFVQLLEHGADNRNPVQDIRSWMKGSKWAIVLSGSNGVGKTLAACAGLVIAGGGLFVTAEEIANPGGRELAEQAEAARYLVLDEMGDEVLTDLALVRIRSLLGSRHKNMRRTALTTNLGLTAWADRYGARLVDWLREGEGFKAYSGPSLRGAK